MQRPPDDPRIHPGTTTGSPERPPQRLAGAYLRFDLPVEVEQLHAEPSWEGEDRNAITLVKEGDLRVILMALRADAHINTHHTDGFTSIQVIEGQLRIGIAGESHDFGTGELVVLGRAVAHEVLALQDAAFLLTIALPTASTA